MTELARITTMEGLVAVLRDRRQALGLSQLDLELSAGFANGYVSQIEGVVVSPGKTYGKGIGPKALPRLLSALGLELAVVAASRDDP